MGFIAVVEYSLVILLPHAWLFSHAWLHIQTFATVAALFSIALLLFGRAGLKTVRWSAPPVHQGWLRLHLVALGLFFFTNFWLTLFPVFLPAMQRVALGVWYGALVILPITLVGALFGLSKLVRILRGLGSAWGLAGLCTALMLSVSSLFQLAWDAPNSPLGRAMQSATFSGVAALLGLFYKGVVSDPAHYTVGTATFQIEIAYACSGIEGLALILSLTASWLFYARRELRIARSLLLIPASLLLIWLLNLVRLVSLIAIGSAGHLDVALGGFHSQAGWILLCSVALAYLLAVNKVRWFRRPASVAQQPLAMPPDEGILSQTNSTAVYLLPMLAILAAGLLVQAVSDGFEALYVLRWVAALGVLYAYRRSYRKMDWRFGWLGIAAGVLVFVLWVALDRWIGGGVFLRNLIGGGGAVETNGAVLTTVGEGLARLGRLQWTAWVAVRAVAAVTTVPLAEELAFRGYIARRVDGKDFEGVAYRSLSLTAVLASSLAFGILHGRMWLAGLLAGVIFAAVAKLRGRLGEAVAAHATANLLIALWVIAHGDYSLW